MKKINQTVMLLAVSDQSRNSMNDYPNVHLECRYPMLENWGRALSKVFTRVIKYDLRKNYLGKGFKKNSEAVVDLVSRYKPKYIIWLADTDFEMSEKLLSDVRELGVLVVGVFFDDLTMFDYYPRYWLKYLDYAVTVDSVESLKLYQALGVEAMFEPCGGLTQVYRKKKLGYKYDVSFVGSNYGVRKQMVEELKGAGVNLTVFGSGWPGKGYISAKSMADVFNQSKINLNFTDGVKQLRARMFEVCLSGGFLLTQYATGLEKLFKIGKEIEVFKSMREAKKKINYYLEHEEERQVIANAGYQRAISNYALDDIFKRIFTKIETGKIKKIRLKHKLMDKQMIDTRKTKLAYSHGALAIAGFFEVKRAEFWREELSLSRSYQRLSLISGLLWIYERLSKPVAGYLNKRVMWSIKSLRQFSWLQGLIKKSFYS